MAYLPYSSVFRGLSRHNPPQRQNLVEQLGPESLGQCFGLFEQAKEEYQRLGEKTEKHVKMIQGIKFDGGNREDNVEKGFTKDKDKARIQMLEK